MFDPSLAFEIDDNGIKIEGGPHIIGGASLPIVNPTMPTIFIQTNGDIYSHDGATSWKLVGNSGLPFWQVQGPREIKSGEQLRIVGPFDIEAAGALDIDANASFILEV